MNSLNIFNTQPASWRELQVFVTQLLFDCEFQVEEEKTIHTVRGKVEVDVFATKRSPFITMVLCECKYWEKLIPQTIVHAFRSVVADSGASKGFIISKKGFQTGAYQAIQNTNVTLLNWEEFQENLKLEWMRSVIDRNYKIGRELMNLSIEVVDVLHNNDIKDQKAINRFYGQKESDFLFFTFIEHYIDLKSHEICIMQIDNHIVSNKKRIFVDVLCYKDYFDFIYKECSEILNEWKPLLNGTAKGTSN